MTTEQDFLPTETQYEEQNTRSGDGLLRFYWMNGDPRLKTGGRFWMNVDDVTSANIVLPNPWKVVNNTFKNGDSDDIYVSPALHIAPIVWRQQNFIKNASGGVESWIEEKKFGKLGQNEGIAFEMLCLVQGIEQPVVMSLRSTKASMAFAANILPDYKKMRDEVKKSRGAQVVPPYWFWLAVRAAIKPDKSPVYETVNGSIITPLVWVAPENHLTDRTAWKSMYVGSELANRGEFIYLDIGKAWAAKRIGEGYSAQPEAVEPAGRNVPQAYAEDENGMPF